MKPFNRFFIGFDTQSSINNRHVSSEYGQKSKPSAILKTDTQIITYALSEGIKYGTMIISAVSSSEC